MRTVAFLIGLTFCWSCAEKVERPDVIARDPNRIAPRNVLLISLDTLRSDHLGSFGNEREEVSAGLDGLAARGVRFTQAISQAPWTTPSHMSLMTSQYPTTHGVNQGWSSYATLGEEDSKYRILPDAAVTLAEVLRENGFATQALTGGGTVAGELGFAQGFDVYEERPNSLHERELLSSWLEEWKSNGDRRHFLFLHGFEIHAPYNRLTFVEPYLDQTEYEEILNLIQTSQDVSKSLPDLLIQLGAFRRDVITALYDGGVHQADDSLGWLFGEMARLGLAEDTLIVVTSDHGEEFGEHDPTRLWDAHCATVYDELIRVPLIIAHPGGPYPAGAELPEQAELIDLAPTILDLLDLPGRETFRGRSLEPLMRYESNPAEERWTFSEATCSGPEMKTLRGERYKYVAAFEAPDEDRTDIVGNRIWEKVFDLENDPLEQNALEDPALLAELRALFEARVDEAVAHQDTLPTTSRIKPGTVDRLRSLGYVE